MMSNRLTEIEIHDTWKSILDEPVMNMLDNIDNQIGSNFTPPADKVLRFMSNDIHSWKVVILGQDPYPAPGAANGRAFQPDYLVDWLQTHRHSSLKNILRLLYKTYLQKESTSWVSENPSYQDVKTALATGLFPIAQPRQWFDSTESQGVLWLNTSLTCETGNSNSHKEIWEQFSRWVINRLSTFNPNLIWFLWGTEAQSMKAWIRGNPKGYMSRHPMMCSDKYLNDFMYSKCFYDTWELIDWLGKK